MKHIIIQKNRVMDPPNMGVGVITVSIIGIFFYPDGYRQLLVRIIEAQIYSVAYNIEIDF